MVRGAAVVYPKDAAQIIGLADIFPGAHVVEAGAGSGALSCWLLRAVGDHGSLTSFERRPDFAEIAAANVERYFGASHPAWRLVVGELGQDGITGADRVVLDMLAPWDHVGTTAAMLAPGGVVCCYVATVTQLARTVSALRDQGNFAEPAAWETLQRGAEAELLRGAGMLPVGGVMGDAGIPGEGVADEAEASGETVG